MEKGKVFKMGNVTLVSNGDGTYRTDFWKHFQMPTVEETNRYRSTGVTEVTEADHTEKNFKRRMRSVR